MLSLGICYPIIYYLVLIMKSCMVFYTMRGYTCLWCYNAMNFEYIVFLEYACGVEPERSSTREYTC